MSREALKLDRAFPGVLPVSHPTMRSNAEEKLRIELAASVPHGFQVKKERYVWTWSREMRCWCCSASFALVPVPVTKEIDRKKAIADKAPI